MPMSVLVFVACLMGAGGVALMAASAHGAPGAGLDSAGSLLLFHAASVIAIVAILGQTMMWRPLGVAGAVGLVVGAMLFAADIAVRAYAGHRLFPMAAPTGGVVLIASWVTLAISALIGAAR
jgi:uncharacterized membrane protein YgdD (TMEM256/DUF423 family)